jgi:hypothetical protein
VSGAQSIPTQPIHVTPVTLLFKITNPFSSPAPVAKGGTEEGTFGKADMLYGNSSNKLSILHTTVDNYALTVNGSVPSWSQSFKNLNDQLTITLSNFSYSNTQSNKLLNDTTSYNNRLNTLSNTISTENNAANGYKFMSDTQATGISDTQTEIQTQDSNLNAVVTLNDAVSTEEIAVTNLEFKLGNVNTSLTTLNNGVISAQQSINNIISSATSSGHNKNKIINGNFKVWQYSTYFSGYLTQTVNYPTADRWGVICPNTTYVVMSKSKGTVGNNNVCDSLNISFAGAGTKILRQYIESVRTLQGQQCTISFWAKSSSNFTLNLTLKQIYSQGGTITTPVNTNFNITTSYQQYYYTFNMPAIPINAIIGTKNCLQINFSSSNNWNIDITNIQLESGNPSKFEFRPYHTELGMCQRYYEIGQSYFLGYSVANNNQTVNNIFKIEKYAVPTVKLDLLFQSGFTTTVSTNNVTKKQISVGCVKNGSTGDGTFNVKYYASCEFNF